MKPFLAALTLLFAFGSTTAHACAMKRVRIKAKPVLMVQTLKDAARAETRGNTRSAIRRYERAMNAKGDVKLKARAAYKAATLHLAEGRTAKARSRLNTAVKFDSRHAMAHAVLARLLAEDGDLSEARAHLKKAQANGAEVDAVVAAERAILLGAATALLGT